jgi:hypothetical protein
LESIEPCSAVSRRDVGAGGRKLGGMPYQPVFEALIGLSGIAKLFDYRFEQVALYISSGHFSSVVPP